MPEFSDPSRATVDVTFTTDTGPIEDALRDLTALSQSFGAQLSGALKNAVLGGKDLDDILRRIGLNLAGMALSSGLQPLQSLAGLLLSNAIVVLAPASASATAVFSPAGAIAAPGYFGAAIDRAGAAGILNARHSDAGKVGSSTGGVTVVFNVTAPDPGAFRKSEAQITGMLTRAVSRGGRTL